MTAPKIVAEGSYGSARCALGRASDGWWFYWRDRWLPLDWDARHRRLFLSTRDERRVGVAGIACLEALTRQAVSRS